MHIRIQSNETTALILLLPFMEPYIIQACFHRVHMLFLLGRILSSALIFIRYVRWRQMKEYAVSAAKPIVSVFSTMGLLLIYLLCNTAVQGDLTLDYAVSTLATISLLLFLENYRNDMRALLHVLLFYLEILIYSNLLCMLLFPSGMYVSSSTGNTTNWLLGYDNFYDQTFLPAMAIGVTCLHLYQTRGRIFLLFVALHISTLLTMSGTVLICLLMLDLFYLLRLYRYLSLSKMALAVLIITVTVVFFQLQTVIEALFTFFGKDSSFTGRTIIWEYTISAIKASPLFGYGFSDGYSRLAKMGYILRSAFNAHNMWLEYCWEGGLISLFLVGFWLIATITNAQRNRHLTCTQLLSGGIAVILVTFLVKAYMQTFPVFVYLLWGLMDYLPELDASKISNETEPYHDT